MIVRLTVCASLTAASLWVPVNAAEPTEPAAVSGKQTADPNERICETITMLGSRINKKRFCGTKAEWEQKRLLDRQEVERAQMGPCVRNGTTCK
jgi:hypothetical protein